MEKKRILAGLLALAMTITFLGVIPVQAQQEDGIAAQWIAREELAAAGTVVRFGRCSARFPAMWLASQSTELPSKSMSTALCSTVSP